MWHVSINEVTNVKIIRLILTIIWGYISAIRNHYTAIPV